MFPLKDSIRIPYPPLITYLLILINAAVFLYQDALSLRDAYDFSLQHALVPRRYFDPAWAAAHGLSPSNYLPFIAGTFMHGSWWHLILNMWTLFIFGASLEGRIGRFGFLSFYLVCGLIASIAHAYFNKDSTVPTLGASGAIAGVLGAYATTFPRAKITILILIVIIPLFFKIPALGYALIWFAFQFLQGFIDLVSVSMGGGIAWWAHIGGFLAGLILIPLWRLGPDRTVDEAEEARQRFAQLEPGPSKSEPPQEQSGWTRGPWD
ncbi:MAG: rhomboid family intramembrane serine protease [Rhodomicrobium sp.]|nr:rhomboid family intramembrane serine protease [Rhodomicrobium sp.]